MTLPLSYSRLRALSRRRLLDAARLTPLLRLNYFTRHSQPSAAPNKAGLPTKARVACRAKVGGEGRVRTSVARWAADLQSAAIDRSATSPIISVVVLFGIRVIGASHDCGENGPVELAEGFEPPTG